jgi:hypothetical protein
VEDELNATVAPPLGAATVNATVQDDPASGVTDIGLHENPFKPDGRRIVTVPSLVEVDKDDPAESADPAFASWSNEEESVVVFETVKDTVATTPSEMAVGLRPHMTHFETPATLLQESDLFEAVATGPGATAPDEKSPAK